LPPLQADLIAFDLADAFSRSSAYTTAFGGFERLGRKLFAPRISAKRLHLLAVLQMPLYVTILRRLFARLALEGAYPDAVLTA